MEESNVVADQEFIVGSREAQVNLVTLNNVKGFYVGASYSMFFARSNFIWRKKTYKSIFATKGNKFMYRV